MKSIKRIAALLVAGFFAFAPPGTLIFLGALALGFVGYRWAAPAAALLLCAVAAAGYVFLRRRRRARVRTDARPGTH